MKPLGELMTANTYRSRKAKGQRLEKDIAKMIETKFGYQATRMAGSGAFRLKGDVFCPQFPWTIEAKNQEKIKFYEFWKQAESQASLNSPPMLVIHSNGKPIIACVHLEDILNMQKEIDDLRCETNKEPKRFSD